jgi:hypothetical protein
VAKVADSSTIDQTYYPSCKVALSIRFDEFGDTGVQQLAPAKPPTVLRGTSSQRSPLEVVQDNSIPNTRRFAVVRKGAGVQPGSPQSPTGSADGFTRWVAGIIPKSASWSQNGVRAGDQLTLKIKFVDCPIDPRTVRAIAVQFFLGSVTADQYARGAAGETRTTTTGQTNYAEPLNVIPDQYTDDQGRIRTNLRFEGWVDKWEVDWDDEGEPVISVECLDNTRLLIDIEAPSALVISSAKPIDQAVANYLANFPTCEGLVVEYRPAGATPPSLGGALAGTAFRPQLGPVPARGGGATIKLAVWDYLTDVCGALGHLIRVEGATIVIQQPQTLLSPTLEGAVRSDDPYQGRTVDGVDRPVRLFLWGRNVRKQHLARNFARREPTNVEVRCYSTRRKKTLVSRFPNPTSQKAKVMVRARPGDAVTDQKWMVWRVRGIEDQQTLDLIARNVYASVCRMQFEMNLETANLASFGGDSKTDPDILDMRTGDTFDLQVARQDDYGTIGQTEDFLISRASEFMRQLGFPPDLADSYARAYTNEGFQTRFRLRTMQVDWDAEESGVGIQIVGTNYIEVRMDQPLSQ